MLNMLRKSARVAAFVALVPIAFMPDIASACPRCQAQAQAVQANVVQAQVVQAQVVQPQVVTAVQPLAVIGAAQPLCGRAARVNSRQLARASRRACRRGCGATANAQVLTTAAVVGVQGVQPQVAPPQNFELVPQQSQLNQKYRLVPENQAELAANAAVNDEQPGPADATEDDRATAAQAQAESVVTAVPQAPVPVVPVPAPAPVSSGVTFELVEVAPAMPATYQLRAVNNTASFASFAAAPMAYAAAPLTYSYLNYATAMPMATYYTMPATFSTFASTGPTVIANSAVGFNAAGVGVNVGVGGRGRRHKSVTKTVTRVR